MWRWDGAQWVPAYAGPPPAARRRSNSWIWWVAGGCALLLLVAVAGVLVGGVTLVRTFQGGGFSCLPSDFPSYPGATVASEHTYTGPAVAPGDSKSCLMSVDTNDNMPKVESFYAEKLSSGDWKVIAHTLGEIRFQRVSRPASVGLVQLQVLGRQTEITIQFDS
jgi:hypothetical protein